ncbi:MAG: putative DNA binding domain-containing protein [Spirochaetaceae bacterium]|nr:putative DNA binding domain-containing protein [Spirochaetaceae bacterium]
MENLDLLVKELVLYSNETEWLEFKHSNFDSEMIGRDISALANSATYRGKEQSYMIWGIDDETHEIIGTNHNRFSKLCHNQEIESYLRNSLSKNANFNFYDTEIDSKKIVVLVIKRTTGQPVTYKKESYIRIGSYTKPLRDYSAMEAQLWDKLRLTNFETQTAKSELKKEEVFSLLDFNNYFDMQGIPIPVNQDGILHYIMEDKIVLKQDNGLYSITNLGALLFAKRITDFPSVSRKAIRVIQYEDDTKLRILKDFSEQKGYAVGFDGVFSF